MCADSHELTLWVLAKNTPSTVILTVIMPSGDKFKPISLQFPVSLSGPGRWASLLCRMAGRKMFSKPSFYVALQGLSQRKKKSPFHESGNFTERITVTSKQKAEDCMGFLLHYLTQAAADTTAGALVKYNTIHCNRQVVNTTFAKILMFSQQALVNPV